MTTNPTKTMVFRFHDGQSLRAVIDTEAPLFYNLRDTAGNPLVVSKDRVREVVPLDDVEPCPASFSGATTDPGHSWDGGACTLCGKPRTTTNPTPASLSPEREAEYRERDAAEKPGHVAIRDLLAELERTRAELAARREDIAFLERNTLPELRRNVEHHKAGKQRWRTRAEKAEARVSALETERAETNGKLVELTVALKAAEKRIAELEQHEFEAEHQSESDAKRRLARCKRCSGTRFDSVHVKTEAE